MGLHPVFTAYPLMATARVSENGLKTHSTFCQAIWAGEWLLVALSPNDLELKKRFVAAAAL